MPLPPHSARKVEHQMEGIAASTWEPRWRTLRELEAELPISDFAPIYRAIIHPDLARLVGSGSVALVAPEINAVTKSKLYSFLKDSPWVPGIRSASYQDTFDDVYHAAVIWRLWCEPIRGKTPHDRGQTWVHRGENKDFPKTTASIQRLPATERLNAIRDLEQFIDTSSMNYPSLDEEQVIALAQHYGGDDGVDLRTWLLDITWDPYVALFFASYRWEPPANEDEAWKSIGRVSSFNVSELEKCLSNNHLRWTTIPGFQRLRNQRALFFDAPDPSIIDDYTPYRVTFHQKPKLVFTDPTMSVSEEHLLGDTSTQGIDQWRDDARPIEEVRKIEKLERTQEVKSFIAKIATGHLSRNPRFHGLRDNPDRNRIVQLTSKMYVSMREDDRIERTSIHWLVATLDSCILALHNKHEVDISNATYEFTIKCRDNDRKYIQEHIAWAKSMWGRRNENQLIWDIELHR